VIGLDPTIDYYFTVVAMSGAGWGNASAPSNVIRPLAQRAPTAPVDVVATPGDGMAMVSWTAPSDPGTGAISDYLVMSDPSGALCVSASASCTVPGLANGTAYTFAVVARSAAGNSSVSAASNPVIPGAAGISIAGERTGRAVTVEGEVVGLRPGVPVEVWVRLDGSANFTRGVRAPLVQPGGGVTWERRVNPLKDVEVYFAAGDLRSDTVTFAARRTR